MLHTHKSRMLKVEDKRPFIWASVDEEKFCRTETAEWPSCAKGWAVPGKEKTPPPFPWVAGSFGWLSSLGWTGQSRATEARNHAALRFGLRGVPFSSPHKPIDAAAN
jgi:hypothetical protein